MENIGKNNRVQDTKKDLDVERFEKNAKVKIHKGKERYNGGSGYYASKKNGSSPTVCDDGAC